MSLNDDLRRSFDSRDYGNDESLKEESNYDQILETRKELNSKLFGFDKEYYNAFLKLAKDAHLKEMQDRIARMKEGSEEKQEAEARLQNEIVKIQERALNIIDKKAAEIQKHGTARERIEINNAAIEKVKSLNEIADIERAKQLENAGNDKALQKQINDAYIENLVRRTKVENDAIKENSKLQQTVDGKRFRTLKEQTALLTEQNKSTFERYQNLKATEQELADDIAERKANGEDTSEQEKQLAEVSNMRRQARNETWSTAFQALGKQLKSAFMDAIDKLGQQMDQTFSRAENLLTEYSGRINANLQGTDKTWKSINELISTNLAVNPFVRTETVLNKMIEASDQGISYNIEQRAFLAGISDKIAHTFDAFDSNLTRLIRLQQADSTIARLGIEASLTRFLNSMFEDTSYLSNMYDSVSSAIIDANSQLSRNQSAEFEYTVQKWLGSLGSLGMSSNAISSIAEGINYLATGDVQGLAGNSSLQTLFAMSANRAGLSYAELLTGGLTARDTNTLLKSMVEYLKEIAENSENQVVKRAYGNIFGLSLSDFRSISNLDQSTIETIAGNNATYNSLLNEVNNQLSFATLAKRTSFAEMTNNVYNNALYGLAERTVDNPINYSLYKLLGWAQNSGIDINIPFVTAAGFGLDLNSTIFSLLKMGLMASQILPLAADIGSAIGRGGGSLNLNSWNAKETVSRGGIGSLLATIIGGTSSSTYIGNTNRTDVTNQTLAGATEEAENTKKITNKNTQEGADAAETAYKALASAASLYNNGDNWFWVKDTLLQLVLDKNDALRVRDYDMNNAFVRVFGSSSVVGNGFVKAFIQAGTEGIPVNVINNPVVRLDTMSTAALAQQFQPKSVSLAAGTKVSIDDEDLKRCIREVFGLSEDMDSNSLGAFIEAALDSNQGIIIKTPNAFDMPVSVNHISNTYLSAGKIRTTSK